MHILFITRKWDGHGGMQQLSRDVWRGMREGYGDNACLCTLVQSPFFVARCSLLVFFVGKAMVWGMMTVWRGGHVHLGDAALAPLGWFLKKVGRGRVTVTACGLDVIWPRRWYQWLLRKTLPAMGCVVCISRATAEAVQKRGVDLGRIRIIPCGVWPVMRSVAIPALAGPANPSCAGPRSSRMAPLLLTIGRLVPRKGVAWFVLEALPFLLRDFPQMQYVIVGSGPEELLIKKIVQEQGLGQCVHLRGELDEARREECFALADLFVAPNIPVAGDMEGFGMVCIEAGLRGVPVVASRLEGLHDAVMDGRTGRFFAPCDAGDCAKVIQHMLVSFEEGEGEMWDRERVARATLEHYGWPRLFRRYRDEVFGF